MNDNNNTQNTPKTIAEAEALAQKYGIALTPQDYNDMYEVMAVRQEQLEREVGESRRRGVAAFVDWFNRIYPRFLQALQGIGDVVITATQTTLIAFGVPVLLVMLMIVEQQRVFHGMALFEVVGPLAAFGASVLVLANLVFELLICWKENQVGYVEPPRNEFSLRILAQRLAYIFGGQSDWRPRPKSPAQRFKGVLRVITFTILVLALAGSMRSVIEHIDGNWFSALAAIVSKSSLQEMITWLGGLLFALAAVLSAQALSQYVAQKVIEVIAIMQSSAADKPRAIMDAVGMSAAAFLMARIKEGQRTRRMAAAAALVMPSNAVSGVYQIVDEAAETRTPTAKSQPSSNVLETKDATLSPKMRQAVQWLDARDKSEWGSHRSAAPLAGVSEATMYRAMAYRDLNPRQDGK